MVSIKRYFSTQNKSISSAFTNLPWNFNSHLRHEKIRNLELPVDMDRGFLSNEEATSLFKDYADAICTNSLD